MFDLVHEVSIIGTTAFMVAVYSIWYSPFLFGRFMKDADLTVTNVNSLIIIYVSFVIPIFVLALLLPLASSIGITWLEVSLAMFMSHATLVVGLTKDNKRMSLQQISVVSFLFVLLVGGGFMVSQWPW